MDTSTTKTLLSLSAGVKRPGASRSIARHSALVAGCGGNVAVGTGGITTREHVDDLYEQRRWLWQHHSRVRARVRE
jgi:hypothetical protein